MRCYCWVSSHVPSVGPFLLPAESSSYLQCCPISGRELKCFQVAFSSLCPAGHLWEQWDRDCREHFLTRGFLKLFALQERNLPGIHPSSCLACCDGSFFLSHGKKAPADFWNKVGNLGYLKDCTEDVSAWWNGSFKLIWLQERTLVIWVLAIFYIHMKVCDVPRLWSWVLAQNLQWASHQAPGLSCCEPWVYARCSEVLLGAREQPKLPA